MGCPLTNALITGHATSTKVDNLSQSSLADHSPPGTVRPVSSPLRPLLLRPSILFTGRKLYSTSAQFCQPVDLQSTSVPCQNGSSLTRDDSPAGPFEDQTRGSLLKGGRIQWHIEVAVTQVMINLSSLSVEKEVNRLPIDEYIAETKSPPQ